jgi:hypothetical protein
MDQPSAAPGSALVLSARQLAPDAFAQCSGNSGLPSGAALPTLEIAGQGVGSLPQSRAEGQRRTLKPRRSAVRLVPKPEAL